MNRASYLRELRRLREHLDAIVEQAFVGAELGGVGTTAPGSWSPAVDLIETADAYILRAEVPGVERSDLDLVVEGRRLILSGRRRPPEGEGNFHRMERHHGPFRRGFELDHELDPEAVEAELSAGVLTVRLAKTERDRRRIEVSGGADDREDIDG